MRMIKQRIFPLCLMLSFLLGCHRGYIALWKYGEANPAEVFPYPVSSLPTADQKALAQGIPISDELALAAILEDFLS